MISMTEDEFHFEGVVLGFDEKKELLAVYPDTYSQNWHKIYSFRGLS